MAVRKAGDRWVVEFMFRGIRIFRRLPAGRGKQDAQALESKLRNQIFDSVDLGRLPDPPLERVINSWAKGKDSKQQSHIKAVLGNVGEATLSQVGQVRDKLVSLWSGLAPGTVNRRLSVLKASAKYAFRKKWTSRNLSADVVLLPEPRYTRREVSMDMAVKLLEAATTRRAKALIAGSAFTGMRLSEVLKFDPKRDLQDGVIRVRDTKNGEDRLIPMHPELEPYLDQFPMKSGWRNVYRGFERARDRAGLNLRYHDLRHMAATAMVNAGKNLRVVGDILGHKSLQTTRKYTHPDMAAKRDALSAITALSPQPRKKHGTKKG